MNLRSQKGQTLFFSLLFIGFAIPATPAFSQLFVEWNKTYGGLGWEEFQTVNKTDDGGYIFGGITTTASPSCQVSETTRDTAVFPDLTGDVWLVKTDGLGNIQWDKRYGGWDQDRMWSVTQTPDGGFILGGESYSGEDTGTEHTEYNRGGLDYWLVKIDANGNHLWNRTYGGAGKDVLRVVIPLDDGGFMLLGYSSSPSFLSAPGDKSEDSRGGDDFWIVRLYPNGNVWWEKTIGGNSDDQLFDALLLPDGNILAAGWSASDVSGEKTEGNFGVNDYWAMKLDVDDASIMWQRTIGGDDEDVVQGVFLTKNNDIVLCGNSKSGPSGNKTAPAYGNHDGWVVRLREESNFANIVWDESYGGAAADLAYSAAETSLGNLMVVGVTSSLADTMAGGKLSPLIGSKDFWINYLDPQGNRLWDFSMGGTDADVCVKIVPAHGYGFIFGGASSSNAYEPYKSDNNCNMNDMYIVRTGCLIEPPGLLADTVTCTNEFISVDATVDSCNFCQYIWDDGATGPVRIISPDSTLDLGLTIVHPDGCEVRDSVSLQILPGIDTLLSDWSPILCFGDNDATFLVEEVVGGAGPFQYSLNEAPWDSLGAYYSLAPGIYTLSVIDTNGCTYDTSFYIEQPQEVLLELGDDLALGFGDSVQIQALTNMIAPNFTFQWGQPDLVSCFDCLEPWVQPLATTTFSIAVQDTNGCEAVDQLLVTVEQENRVYIPNAFSPNNDNINDFFTVYADQTVRQVTHLKIYDRWGELMYERSDFPPNVGPLGWDGRHNGKFMQPNVFAYWAEVEYRDGRKERFEGDVTLVR